MKLGSHKISPTPFENMIENGKYHWDSDGEVFEPISAHIPFVCL
ncbi:MAG TPA: hypothetical protein VN285_08380 [Candidatus Deferrimicrobium sp.]|nr:hypothetical protein [Candidatus Deferrimicrobium sp.]